MAVFLFLKFSSLKSDQLKKSCISQFERDFKAVNATTTKLCIASAFPVKHPFHSFKSLLVQKILHSFSAILATHFSKPSPIAPKF
ncbi:MAG: hypothetical protein D3903_06875 [Candidatus Electrothrix sp. GM3_4]|nr:hypothetical protein [Candidatus Electrothrix sp. GM3_4]